MSRKILLSATINGTAITLLTGLIPDRTTMLVGADYNGYPFPWLIRLVLAPQYFPWRVNLLYLIADIVAWTLISVAVLLIIPHRRRTMKTRLESETMGFSDPMETLRSDTSPRAYWWMPYLAVTTSFGQSLVNIIGMLSEICRLVAVREKRVTAQHYTSAKC